MLRLTLSLLFLFHCSLGIAEPTSEIGVLTDDLASPDAWISRVAAQSFVAGGQRHVAFLTGLLQKADDARTRFHAAWILGEIGEPFPISVLKKVAEQDPDPAVRTSALIASVLLGNREEAALARLTELLTDSPDPAIRWRAAAALDRWKKGTAYRRLVEELGGARGKRRERIVQTLCARAPERAVRHFRKELRKHEVSHRLQALGDLELILGASLLEAGWSHGYYRRKIRLSYGEIEEVFDKQAVDRLSKILEADKEAVVRKQAASVLGTVGLRLVEGLTWRGYSLLPREADEFEEAIIRAVRPNFVVLEELLFSLGERLEEEKEAKIRREVAKAFYDVSQELFRHWKVVETRAASRRGDLYFVIRRSGDGTEFILGKKSIEPLLRQLVRVAERESKREQDPEVSIWLLESLNVLGGGEVR